MLLIWIFFSYNAVRLGRMKINSRKLQGSALFMIKVIDIEVKALIYGEFGFGRCKIYIHIFIK